MNVIRNALEPWKSAFNSWPAMTFLTAGFTDKLLLNKILLVICFQCSNVYQIKEAYPSAYKSWGCFEKSYISLRLFISVAW